MGRRKIEIKAIKDDRNRSVTFLKRKGGLFKKAHELSVLCSVDVAVIIFGSNKKLYEYSSGDLRELVARWTYHGNPNEHKGPADFNGADEDDDDENGTPPQGEGMDTHVFPSHIPTIQPPFPHIRHHTPSASPPMPNGVFGAHPGNGHRGHTPQPQMGSRPASRNDVRRMGPTIVGQPVGPPGAQPPSVNGFSFMQQQGMYGAQTPSSMPPAMPHGLPQPHHQYPYPQPQAQSQPHQMQPYVDERRSSGPPPFAPQTQGPPTARHSVSPPQPPAAQLPSQPVPHLSPPPPQPQAHPMQSPPQHQQHLPPPPPPPSTQEPPVIRPPSQETQAPVPVKPEPRSEPVERARQPLLLDTNIKKQPPRKGGSIFTPIDENQSVLLQHIAAFQETPPRSQSMDVGSVSRGSNPNLPAVPQRPNTQAPQPQIKRNGSLGTIPDAVFTPPSRSNSLQAGGASRPRLKVQIPDESDGGSTTNGSTSPRATTSTDITSQPSRRPADSHASGVVLPPPSPSASAMPNETLLSAGATGPPNPFARPLPHQNNNNNNNMNIDTPVSALPSRFLNNEFLPSPSSFYPDWNFRGNDSNTLPSPLNFATPVVGTGPSFLRDDPLSLKRKSPEISGSNGAHPEPIDAGSDAKRAKVES